MEKVETKRVPLGSREAFTDLFRRAAPSAGTALCGAALAGIVFQGEEAPFAAALCAGASGGLYIPASLGACVGAFVFGDSLDVLRQVAAVTLVFLLRSAAKYVLRVKVGAPAAGMMAFLSVLLAAETVAAAASPDAASVLLGFAKALAAFAAACFFYRVFLLAPDGGIFAPAAPGDRAAILFSGSVLLLSLVRFRFGAFVPVHIPGFVLVMAAALIGGETAGAVVGICTGLVLGTADGAGFLLAALPAAGLAGGIVSCYGKAAVGSVFALVYALALSVGGAPGTVARVAEAGAGILLFICLPKRVADGFSEKLSAMDPAERDPGRLFLRLGVLKAAKAVRRISALMTASQQLGHRQRPSAEALTAGLRQAVCADCKKQDFCFGDALELTQKAFAEATETLGRTGTLDAGSLPARLRTLCPSPASAAEGICSCMREMSVRQAAEQAARDCRAQSAAAISQLAGVMEAAAGRAREEDDPNLAALARNVLRGQGYAVSAVRFTHAGGGVLTVLCRRVPENAGIGRLKGLLEEKLDLRFAAPGAERCEGEGTLLTFPVLPNLRAEAAVRTAPATGQTRCGDCVETFTVPPGTFYALLSDGMGTGSAAALQSTLVLTMLRRLLQAGIDPACAIETANRMLMLSGEEETLATLDLVQVDLGTGETVLYKAGAAATLVEKSKRAAVLEPSSMPLGILQQPKTVTVRLKLAPGDKLVLLSDGAAVCMPEEYKSLLYRHRGADADETAELLLNAAGIRQPGRQDDRTAVCIFIKEEK
ncbi:MAG: SpoIIE family protein phosphatase [Clostridia bacterium]|nr:SpoIIE family protein phosphatase [Clostridia bacterium]